MLRVNVLPPTTIVFGNDRTGTDPRRMMRLDELTAPELPTRLNFVVPFHRSWFVDRVVEDTTVRSVTVNGSDPSMNTSTLFITLLFGSFLDERVVYWNSRSRMSPAWIWPVLTRVNVGDAPEDRE